MTGVYHQEGPVMQPWSESWAHQLVKAATAVTAGGSLLVLSGLTLTATVIALTVATPILVIFSPVLLPAVITVFLLATGFFTSGGFGVAAAMVLAWMYRYASGEHTTGEESLEHMTRKLGSQGRDREEHDVGSGHHATGGVHLTTGARAGLYRS